MINNNKMIAAIVKLPPMLWSRPAMFRRQSWWDKRWKKVSTAPPSSVQVNRQDVRTDKWWALTFVHSANWDWKVDKQGRFFPLTIQGKGRGKRSTNNSHEWKLTQRSRAGECTFFQGRHFARALPKKSESGNSVECWLSAVVVQLDNSQLCKNRLTWRYQNKATFRQKYGRCCCQEGGKEKAEDFTQFRRSHEEDLWRWQLSRWTLAACHISCWRSVSWWLEFTCSIARHTSTEQWSVQYFRAAPGDKWSTRSQTCTAWKVGHKRQDSGWTSQTRKQFLRFGSLLGMLWSAHTYFTLYSLFIRCDGQCLGLIRHLGWCLAHIHTKATIGISVINSGNHSQIFWLARIENQGCDQKLCFMQENHVHFYIIFYRLCVARYCFNCEFILIFFQMFAHLVIISCCAKLLLLPCYTSTDFEVHRNWLAITNSLPIDEWYTEATSEWTLDYPPFFAWFECIMAKIASWLSLDDEMLLVQNLNHKSFNTVLFQRLSVIVTDLVLVVGVKICCTALNSKPQKSDDIAHFLPALALSNAGLVIVDHVHFQYNGFLLGILLSSIGFMMQERHLASAFLFAVLLNLKHIYLYCAPAYFVFLLSSYCRPPKAPLFGFSPLRLISLAVIVLATFALSFGPFIMNNQLFTVLQRLFPFKRGLTHAYWAPNFWALYNAIDRAGLFLAKKTGALMISDSCASGASTSGLVQDTTHCILPNVPPLATFLLTATSQLPILWRLWQSRGDSIQFLRAVILCNFCSFIFGWWVPCTSTVDAASVLTL